MNATNFLHSVGTKNSKLYTSKVLWLAMITGMGLFFQSCLKENLQYPTEPKLTIVFTPETLAFNKIDSGAVIFKKQGSLVPIFKRLQKSGGKFEVDMEDLSFGNWTSEIYVYTSKDAAGMSNQYLAKLSFVKEQITGIVIPAPTAAGSAVWKKSEVLSTPDNGVIVIVPLDITDPYFEIQVRDLKWDSVFVEKGGFKRNGNMNEQVGLKTWTCTSNCFGTDRIISNFQAFAVFAEQMKTTSWNNADVTIILTDQQGATQEFYHAWNK